MSTTTLATLKLTAARKPRALPDAVKRRNKLLGKLKEQRELALAQSEGRTLHATTSAYVCAILMAAKLCAKCLCASSHGGGQAKRMKHC